MLQAGHEVAALVLKNPIVKIDKSEADKLANGIQGVLKYHSINVSPAMLAWVQLIGAASFVYVPRVGLTIAAKKATQKAQQNNAAMQAGPQSNAPTVATPASGNGMLRFD